MWRTSMVKLVLRLILLCFFVTPSLAGPQDLQVSSAQAKPSTVPPKDILNVGTFDENVRLVADQQALPRILEILDRTQTSVDLLQFSFAIDRQGVPDPNSLAYKIAEKLVSLKK